MRLKRLMSIVLAVALVLSFAMSASAATKLYYAQDFSGYANFDAFAENVYYADLTVKTATATAADVAGARSAGLNMMTKKANFSDAKWSISNKNSNGNNMLEGINSLGDTGFSFITDESWVANANEKYIISFELTSNYLPWGGEARTHYNIHVIGNNGTAETPKYQTGVICQMTGGGTAGILTNTSGSSNWDTQTFVLGTPKRLVYIFEQSGNGLTRTVLADGASWHTCSNFLENMKSVDGLNYLICANFPAVSDVKMYTVGKSDALAVTSDINGKEVALSTDKVTLTFSQPVYEKSLNANSITVTADGEELSGVTLGDITTTGTVGGVYTSSVDVNLPALAMSTNYEITVSGVANELGATLADSTISFSTPKPEFEISEPTISNATKGAMSEASVTIANNTASTSKYISLIYAVYNTAGTLADVVYANDTVAAKTTATITAGLKLGDDAVKAKVMVWNGLDLNAVNPFRGFVDANVAQ